MSFQNLGLQEALLRAIKEKNYNTPTLIQSQVIPLILQGRDVMGGAQTGTGKTAGFTLPLLQLLSVFGKKKKPRALILSPTRELAAQIGESVKTYGKYLPLKSTTVFGGASMRVQSDFLRRGVDIVIATPGRLLDHASQRTIDLSQVEILVLDEADRMLDMGFLPDIRKILRLLPEKRQNLLFSATFPNEIKTLGSSFLQSPQIIEANPQNTAADLISQHIHPVDSQRKNELLSFLISSHNWNQVLIFTRTKHRANRLSQYLADNQITSTAFHGNKSQAARMKALADFHRGKVRTLVATDIASRGIDIAKLSHVINFDLPSVPEDYIHRIGRTGRAGEEGTAISLVCIDELQLLRNIEKLLRRKLPQQFIPGFEPDSSIRPQPIFKRQKKTTKEKKSFKRYNCRN
ncbi:MAG TPA: DEAD/DEAH box helicase [Chlamydiales bacterium]|nr:DEAD/DEAH box helicase [Chlamydiales bacterium]